MQKHSTMEAVLTLTTGIKYIQVSALRFSRVCDPIIQTKLSQTHCRLYVCLKVKLTCFGRDWTTLHSNRPQKKKHDLTSKRGHLHISRFISVTEQHIYLVAAKFNTSKRCGLWKSQVCFLNWPTDTFLIVKSDIINQRLYFLTTGKMPIFSKANDRYVSARKWRTRKNSKRLRGRRVELIEIEVQWRRPPGVGYK